jgi:DNA-binding XRE family transcriptional regulator
MPRMTILTDLRVAAGLTPEAAAERLNVHRATIYAWEAGSAIPSRENCRAIVAAYNATDEQAADLARAVAFGGPL